MTSGRERILRMLVAAIATFAISAAASAALVITEVMPGVTGGTPGTINGDWWELTNTGPLSVNLSGYHWGDTEDTAVSGDTNFFPNISINPGQSIIILEELAANEAAWRTNWAPIASSVVILGTDEMVDDSTPDGDTYSGLSGSGDSVNLYDSLNALVNSFTYSASSQGKSFEISRNGANLGLSVAGEFGAITAVNGDVGSPGLTVPEPASLLTLLTAVVAIFVVQRRR
jgi:lamin tail-like protein